MVANDVSSAAAALIAQNIRLNEPAIEYARDASLGGNFESTGRGSQSVHRAICGLAYPAAYADASFETTPSARSKGYASPGSDVRAAAPHLATAALAGPRCRVGVTCMSAVLLLSRSAASVAAAVPRGLPAPRDLNLVASPATAPLHGLGAPFHVLDLDPFGSPAPLIDAAIAAIAPGGLLAVSALDGATLRGDGRPEVRQAGWLASVPRPAVQAAPPDRRTRNSAPPELRMSI